MSDELKITRVTVKQSLPPKTLEQRISDLERKIIDLDRTVADLKREAL